MSETDFSTLAGQQDDEPPIPGTPPNNAEELLPGLETESRPGDLSGESDGVPSLSDGVVDEQPGNISRKYSYLPHGRYLETLRESKSQSMKLNWNFQRDEAGGGGGGGRGVQIKKNLP